MLGYKLVSRDYKTRVGFCSETEWKIGKTVSAHAGEMKLCTDTVVHYYTDPVLAMIMNPIHANIHNPRMLEVETSEDYVGDGLKYGCKSITPIREIKVPEVTLNQRIAFGILSALEVYQEAAFRSWANKWLSGEDRTYAATYAAAAAADAARAARAARAATYADAARAARAARAAAAATYAAAAAADAARAARAARAATYADAARAARAATYAADDIDFIKLSKEAMKY